jgi:sporulation protein YlmC with PRC-barrel domain
MVSAGVLLACTAMGMAQATQPHGSIGSPTIGTDQGMTGQQQGKLILNKASEVIGREVTNLQNEKLGHIRELAVDGKTGQVAYAVLEFDKLSTSRDKLFAVPWQALNPKTDTSKWFHQKVFVLDVPKQKLESAPSFDRSNWPDMANPEWGTQIHQFYGQEPYWQQKDQRSMKSREEERSSTPNARTERQTDVDVEANADTERQVTEEQMGRSTERERERSTAATEKRMILKAKEQLIGKEITDTSGKAIGNTKELLIDRRTGRIALTVIKLSDVRGNDMAALPWDAVSWRWNEQEKKGTLALNVSSEQVKMHLFSNSQWPDFENRTELTSLYRAYNARPFWMEQPTDVMGFQD